MTLVDLKALGKTQRQLIVDRGAALMPVSRPLACMHACDLKEPWQDLLLLPPPACTES